jgi:tetratricopeptide (TPR) repeat protein
LGAVLALAPWPALAARARTRARRPVRTQPVDPADAVAATDAADAMGVRRQFVRTLAQRLGCSPEDFTHPGALERALRRAGVSDETATRAELMLRALDSASYDRVGALPTSAPREAANIARAVDREALSRRELPFWLPAAIVALSVTAAGSLLAADPAAMHFARGVSAYVRQDYAGARAAFSDAAAVAPRSADAWANYGTASWSLSDTAAAVYGWRQALALQPDAEDLQLRATLAHDMGMTSPGWVPELPSHVSVWLFALLWIAGWTFAWIARRPHPWAARAVLPTVVCALVVGVLAVELEARIDGLRLAVVRHAASLSSDPAIGMDRGPAVAAGEIVRIAGRRGTWTRVEASDDRDGWIPSSELLRIADRHPPRD